MAAQEGMCADGDLLMPACSTSEISIHNAHANVSSSSIVGSTIDVQPCHCLCNKTYISARWQSTCMLECLQLRSIDRLLDRLQSSTSGNQAPSIYSLPSGDLSERIEGLKRERDELCFH